MMATTRIFLVALVAAVLMMAPGALAQRGGNLGVRNQMALDSEVANIYSAVNGYESTFQATRLNSDISAAVPYGTIPSLYLTNSYDGAGNGYYWGTA